MRRISLTVIICALSLTMSFDAEGKSSCCSESGKCMVKSDADRAFFEAMENLNLACKMVQKIENEEIKLGILSELEGCKKCLQMEYFSKNFDVMLERATTLHENIYEILADCRNADLKTDIPFLIGKVVELLEFAQKA